MSNSSKSTSTTDAGRSLKGRIDAASTGENTSALWHMMEQLDESFAHSAEREREEAQSGRRSSDDGVEHQYSLPMALIQRFSGTPMGFECVDTITWSVSEGRRTHAP